MKTKNGFVLLENKEDVKKWLNSQKVPCPGCKCDSGMGTARQHESVHDR